MNQVIEESGLCHVMINVYGVRGTFHKGSHFILESRLMSNMFCLAFPMIYDALEDKSTIQLYSRNHNRADCGPELVRLPLMLHGQLDSPERGYT